MIVSHSKYCDELKAKLKSVGYLNDVVVAQGIVMDLASAGLPPSVAGIVGLNILSQYDVEFHFLKEQIAFYAVGAANRGDCDMQGLQKLALAPVQYSLPGLQVRYNSDLVYVYICSLFSVRMQLLLQKMPTY